MNWWQAILTVTLGNLIVLIPMVFNGHAGTKYGITFPVFARAAFGTNGHACGVGLAWRCRLWLVRHSDVDRRVLPSTSCCPLQWPGLGGFGGDRRLLSNELSRSTWPSSPASSIVLADQRGDFLARHGEHPPGGKLGRAAADR
jgi:hypothetical protein